MKDSFVGTSDSIDENHFQLSRIPSGSKNINIQISFNFNCKLFPDKTSDRLFAEITSHRDYTIRIFKQFNVQIHRFFLNIVSKCIKIVFLCHFYIIFHLRYSLNETAVQCPDGVVHLFQLVFQIIESLLCGTALNIATGDTILAIAILKSAHEEI